MANISIKVPDDLYEQLKQKAHAMGELKLSDALRILLKAAVENPTDLTNRKAKGKELQYLVTTYYLVNEYITSLEGKGTKLNNAAHKKAEKALADLK
jgi:antitoxin component of RelBE/YafQ-DinJ toxin-antitoxin module